MYIHLRFILDFCLEWEADPDRDLLLVSCNDI